MFGHDKNENDNDKVDGEMLYYQLIGLIRRLGPSSSFNPMAKHRPWYQKELTKYQWMNKWLNQLCWSFYTGKCGNDM